MMVSTVYIASDFADTFDLADELNSPSAVSKVLVVIIMLGTLWVPALLFIGMDWLLPRKELKEGPIARAVNQKIQQYMSTVIPAVYEAKFSVPTRLWRELSQHHTLFGLLAAKSAQKRRGTIYRMLTVLTFVLFLTAVFFDVSNPGDNGTCGSCVDERECLYHTSPFDRTRHTCSWDGGSST
jgi:hypothetical protein